MGATIEVLGSSWARWFERSALGGVFTMAALVLFWQGCGTPQEGGIRGVRLRADASMVSLVAPGCEKLACPEAARCQVLDGDARCTCPEGFAFEDGACADVDECLDVDLNACAAEATCENTAGGYDCACRPGFVDASENGENTVRGLVCDDIDECADGEVCGPREVCINEPGSFRCQCEAPIETDAGLECSCSDGFEADGDGCRDVDECTLGTHDCLTPESCTNTPGGFECACGADEVGDARSQPCHCELSGYWVMRQDVLLNVPEQSLGGTVFIQEGQTRATVWELHRYDYDGETIRVQKRGCGTDTAPQIYSPFYEEVYASSVPNSVFDSLSLIDANDIELPTEDAQVGVSFVTPVEGAVIGIALPDRENSPWPASYTDVPADAWVDTDGDGVPGISMWPLSTLLDPGNGLVSSYSYLPVELEAGTTLISRRAGCVSIGTRVLTRTHATLDSCREMSGRVENLSTDVRIQGCTVLGSADWDTEEVKCDANTWRKARKCTAEQIAFLDGQEQNQTASATFDLIKISSLSDPEPTCQTAREALPADSTQ